MALPAQSYVWFRLRHVVGLWVSYVTNLPASAVLYDVQNQPRPSLPYVGLVRRDFPFAVFDDELIVEVPTAVTLTVTASAVGETAALTLFGTRYAYTLTGADDTEAARDALLDAIGDDLCRLIAAGDGTDIAVGFQPCTAVASGTDAIAFAGLGSGPVWVTAVEGCTLGTPTLADRHVQTGLRRAVVRVELYWPERQNGFDTIDEYAEVLRSSLQNESTAWWLAARGVGVENQAAIAVQEASAVSGAARQRRKFFDVIFNAQSSTYRTATVLAGVTPPTVEILAP